MAHIALFCSSLVGGGAERIVVNLAKEFHALGHEVDLVLLEKTGEYLDTVPDNINVIGFDCGINFKTVLAARDYLQQRKPDVVMATLVPANIAALAGRLLSRHKPPVHLRIDNTISKQLPHEKLTKRLRVRLLYPLADSYICVSRGVAEDCHSYLGLSKKKLLTIYNPLYVEDIVRQSKEPVNHPFFTDNKVPVLTAMGRLAPQKDYPTMLKAFAIARRTQPMRLAILGKGEKEQQLKTLCQQLGIQDDVCFMGFNKNPYPYVRRSDLFVVSSEFEGFCNVIVEAIACGTPVVSTDCPHGPSEILQKGRFGKLTPVGDPEALAAAILEGLKQPVVAPNALLKRAREFSIEHIIPQYLDTLLQS